MSNGATPLPPHTVEAEEALLGSLLLDSQAYFDLDTTLTPADFFIVRNGWVWEAIARLHDRGHEVDYVSVVEELRRVGKLEDLGGAAYLTNLVNHTPASIYAETYAQLIFRAAYRRRMLAAASELGRLAYDENTDHEGLNEKAEDIMAGLVGIQPRGGLQRARSIMPDMLTDLERARSGAYLGLPTGFADVDTMMGGMQKSDLIIVAGRPGMGKTSWLLSVASHALPGGSHIAIFSLEMGKQQIMQRLASMTTHVPTERMRQGVDDREYALMLEWIERQYNMTLWIDETPQLTVRQIEASAKRLHRQFGLDLVIVDYLQLMDGGKSSENRTQEVSEISRGLKVLARKLNVPVLAASQLSRAVEQRQRKIPVLSDLRESGTIEQDADIVMFLYRDEYYNEDTDRPNEADLIIAKHRNGPTGTVPLYFLKEYTQFGDLKRAHIDLTAFNAEAAMAVTTPPVIHYRTREPRADDDAR